jgi:hypothetical protein
VFFNSVLTFVPSSAFAASLALSQPTKISRSVAEEFIPIVCANYSFCDGQVSDRYYLTHLGADTVFLEIIVHSVNILCTVDYLSSIGCCALLNSCGHLPWVLGLGVSLTGRGRPQRC